MSASVDPECLASTSMQLNSIGILQPRSGLNCMGARKQVHIHVIIIP